MPGSALGLFFVLLGPPVEAPADEPEPISIPTGGSWTEVPAPAPPPRAPKVPFDGGGALATGSVMLVGSLATAAGSIVLAIRPDRPGEGVLGVGSALLGAGGAGVLVAGVKTRRKFRTTELGRVVEGPTTGRAMQAGSLMAFAAGSLGLLTGVLIFNSPSYCPNCFEPPSEAIILMGVGPGVMTAGAIMFMISQFNRAKYRKWMKQRPLALQPSVKLGPGAMQVGVVGRF